MTWSESVLSASAELSTWWKRKTACALACLLRGLRRRFQNPQSLSSSKFTRLLWVWAASLSQLSSASRSTRMLSEALTSKMKLGYLQLALGASSSQGFCRCICLRSIGSLQSVRPSRCTASCAHWSHSATLLPNSSPYHSLCSPRPSNRMKRPAQMPWSRWLTLSLKPVAKLSLPTEASSSRYWSRYLPSSMYHLIAHLMWFRTCTFWQPKSGATKNYLKKKNKILIWTHKLLMKLLQLTRQISKNMPLHVLKKSYVGTKKKKMRSTLKICWSFWYLTMKKLWKR